MKSSDSFTLDLDEKLGRALVYIKENLNRTITLNELARISILSPSHLSHEFKKKYKISPMKMHKKNRMQAIRNRLVNVNATLSELADEYGYSNSFSLSRGIKKNFGSSPRAIKKLNS
ncbi:MAG TPA: hypothetical protein DC049_20455 [Spirochaetia bacterium]|nr:hypothetical protein [Spirochaetia bacterium]